ncbi:MAG: YggS family pyridoxal phosphate-dependent enzyme, partial [Bacilli bacterium]
MIYLEKLKRVEHRILNACFRSNRNRNEVQMIAVTKYSSNEDSEALIEAGCLHIGENRVQAALPKWEALHHFNVTWHFIGNLQTNKVKEIIPRFHYLHSLDRLSLAQAIHKQCTEDQKISCFVQVNISGENSKSGIEPPLLIEFINELQSLPQIYVCGLMTMAPRVDNPEETRPIFRELRAWRDKIRRDSVLGDQCRY